MYKCVNGSAPDYLCELISSYTIRSRTNALTVLLLTIFVSSSRHTHQHVDSDPYHKAWLFNPKLHQKLMVKGVSLSWVLSSGTLFPLGYGLCQVYHHLRNI